jgi:hypothetical protein
MGRNLADMETGYTIPVRLLGEIPLCLFSEIWHPWNCWNTMVDQITIVRGPAVKHSYEVLIIGGGVVGCAIARELSRYRVRTALLEKEADVGMGASCRNSGVLHCGFKYAPGTLRAVLDVRGNAMMDALCRDLKVKMKRIGKLTVALDEEDEPMLGHLKEQGDANGVPGLEVIDRDRMQRIQAGVEGYKALYSPSSAIVSPYNLTIALAENARANGVDFHLGRRSRRSRGRSRAGRCAPRPGTPSRPISSSMPRACSRPTSAAWSASGNTLSTPAGANTTSWTGAWMAR